MVRCRGVRARRPRREAHAHLDLAIPLVQVPITPGKNITVIAEVIALHYLVKVYGGFSPAEKLNQHMLEVMKRKSATRSWVREDTE